MRSRRNNTLNAGPLAGLFTLLLFVAYLVYVPLHMASEAHCILPGHVDHTDHGHHDHDGEDSHHDHHSADDHDVKFTGKDGSLKLVPSFVTMYGDVLVSISDIGHVFLAEASATCRSGPSRSPSPSRAPPVA